MKINFGWGVAIVLAFVILVMYTCNKCGHGITTGSSRTDTLSKSSDTSLVKIHKDTASHPIAIYIQVHDTIFKRDTSYVPKYRYKIRVDSFTVYEKPGGKDTSELAFLPESAIDSAEVVRDWLATRHYSDTLPMKYGRFILSEDITHNSIANRHWTEDYTIPVVTNNTTVNRKTVIGRVGFNLMGSKINPLFGYGAKFGLQFFNNRIYEVGVKYTIQKDILYEGGINFPITFKRK